MESFSEHLFNEKVGSMGGIAYNSEPVFAIVKYYFSESFYSTMMTAVHELGHT